ncbi:MAG: hypothetical protein IKU34_03605 [Clostridia bacterium]|nr:hypothetical protein [Clostridia bacterium]
MQHTCPYCSYPITSENVLFQYNSRKMPYRDERRYAFYTLCSKSWPLTSDKFEGLYFFADDAEDGQIVCDSTGFPQSITVKPCNGKTPSQLEEMEIPGAPLTDYISQYSSGNPHAAQDTGMGAAVPASVSVFSTQSAPEQKSETNQLDDDGSLVTLATRACPNCHNELHQRFGQIETINVTLLGGPSAGKTAYLLSLVHQLSIQLAARGLGTAQLLKASYQYYSYLNTSFKQMRTTMSTVRDEKLFPFIFYYRNEWNKECFVKFSDIAGETTAEADSLLNHNGTMEASTLLMILDPNQLNGGMFTFTQNPGNDHYSTSSSVESFNEDIPSYITKSIAINLDLGAFKNVSKVIAVFSKMDMVLTARKDAFGAGRTDVDCVVRYDLGNAHRGALDEAVINRVGRDLDRFINLEMGMRNFNLRAYLRSLFPGNRNISVLLLGVSTHTLVDAKEIEFKNYCHENAPKHRIIEPFLCILAQNGMIPIRFAARKEAQDSKNK